MRLAGRHPGGARDDESDSCETEKAGITKLAAVEEFLRLEARKVFFSHSISAAHENCSKIEALTA
jgi:hypothetical protein